VGGRRRSGLKGQGQAPSTPKTVDSNQGPGKGRWKDRVTFIIAIWGAALATVVFARDSYQFYQERLPKFYVRAQVEGSRPSSSDQPVGHITIRVTNIGTATGTLDSTLYVLTINSRTGDAEQTQLTFSDSTGQSGSEEYVPGRPPTLATGEEASATEDHLVLPVAERPLDYIAVKFRLVGGRRYLATITEPMALTKDRATGTDIGWTGVALAEPEGWF